MINFILGLIIGGLIVMVFMCLLQINRINEMQNRINKAIKYVKNNVVYDTGNQNKRNLLRILGGDVDDE